METVALELRDEVPWKATTDAIMARTRRARNMMKG